MSVFTICASGPSLNEADCEAACQAGCEIIAVNSSWRMVPGCSHIYAGDLRWWDKNIQDVPRSAALWSNDKMAIKRHQLKDFPTDTGCTFNSGQRAILLAHWLGASAIILLGFDCSIADGSHWHGDHSGLDNPTMDNIRRWRGEFDRTALLLSGKVKIFNSSRKTALTCFPRLPLYEALREAYK